MWWIRRINLIISSSTIITGWYCFLGWYRSIVVENLILDELLQLILILCKLIYLKTTQRTSTNIYLLWRAKLLVGYHWIRSNLVLYLRGLKGCFLLHFLLPSRWNRLTLFNFGLCSDCLKGHRSHFVHLCSQYAAHLLLTI